MEPPSASPHRAHVPWQGLLLAASFLTLWSSPTTAQLTVESVPSDTAEGKDVLLLIHNLPDGLTGFRWYKGDRVDSNQQIIVYVRATQTTTPGPAYSQRETIYHNGSLLFQNVTKEDTGLYTLQTVDANLQSMMASVQLRVYPELPKPFITSSSSHPVEGVDSVALTCGPETQNTAYLWWINGQSILDGDRLQLSNSNRTLTVLSVTRRDTGPYECGTQNPVRAYHSDPVSLNVSSSNPPAQYSWLINGRPQQATQELFIPNLTAHHSGSYTCRVHSSVTGLSRTAVKNITVSACTEAHTRKATRMADASQPVETGDESPENENTTGLHVGAVAGFITGVLVGVTLVTTLGCVLLRIRTRRAGIQHGLREPQSSPSTPGHGPSGGSTALAPLPGHTTALPIYEELLNPDLNVYCRINPRAEAAA